MEFTREQLAARLKDARRHLGLTQAQVAERLGMHRPTVSEIEAGRRAVTSEELYRFSRIYERPVSSFLRESPGDQVERVLFRKGGIADPTARIAVRRFAERCRTERELEELLGLEPRASGRPTYRVRPPRAVMDAVKQGEQIAERERIRLGLGIEPLRNPLDLMERQGVRIAPLEGVAEDGLDGIYFETEGLGACVGVNTDADGWTGFRIAFTVAHEYAHWLLHDVEAEPLRPMRFTKDLREVRANAFAAAFLMPREGVQRYFAAEGMLGRSGQIDRLTPADIVRAMDYFGVSRPALQFRLKTLRLISEAIHEEARSLEFSVTGIAKALGLALRTEFDLSTRPTDMAIRAWRQGLITTGRAADLLGIDVQEFRQKMADIGEEVEPADEFLIGASAWDDE
jgi:Zn-dependent peptidase ImmA (M78 family)/transcriptional regulator with XRE-family HTH domain